MFLHESNSDMSNGRFERIAGKDCRSAGRSSPTPLRDDRRSHSWEVVFAAYGWKSDLSDEEILEKLLALNLEKNKKEVV